MSKRSDLHFGIKTRQYFAYEDLLHVWQEADTLPLIEHAWLFDHPMPIGSMDSRGPCLDGWTLLAALAAQTRRLRLGLLVASNVNQTPPWLAKRAATVDIISHGRLECGLGAGGAQREQEAYGTDFFPAAQRIGRLSETCEMIRRLWTEPTVDLRGGTTASLRRVANRNPCRSHILLLSLVPGVNNLPCAWSLDMLISGMAQAPPKRFNTRVVSLTAIVLKSGATRQRSLAQQKSLSTPRRTQQSSANVLGTTLQQEQHISC